jgi:membrane protease YdiL (CAAX protease family)
LEEIGFLNNKILKNISIGITIGILSFLIAYAVEMTILNAQGLNPKLEFYISGFSLTEDIVKNTGLLFFILCISLNIVNVIMEEGIFRGLFLNLAKEKYSFMISNLIVAFFFGIWHFVVPLRSYIDGHMNFITMISMGLGYIILAGIMSIKWGMIRFMNGSIWIGLAEHFFNNTIGNLLHVTTSTGVDELQILRIVIAQLLTFSVIGVLYKRNKKVKIF